MTPPQSAHLSLYTPQLIFAIPSGYRNQLLQCHTGGRNRLHHWIYFTHTCAGRTKGRSRITFLTLLHFLKPRFRAPKGNVIFQPSIFRDYVSFREGAFFFRSGIGSIKQHITFLTSNPTKPFKKFGCQRTLAPFLFGERPNIFFLFLGTQGFLL